MIEDFFDHTCNIFHSTGTDESPGYGLPASPRFKYGEEPDETEVPCHFHVRNASITIEQKDPMNDMRSGIKLSLPAGTDIRLNDKVVSGVTGLEYTAGVPRNIRGHHTIVQLRRVDQQRPL